MRSTQGAVLPLRTFALLVLGWRALWLGQIAAAQARLVEAMGDAAPLAAIRR